MSLTNIFFNIAVGISVFFALCFIVLFVAYTVIYRRVNKNFKAVDHDQSNCDDYCLDFDLAVLSLGPSNPLFSRSFLV